MLSPTWTCNMKWSLLNNCGEKLWLSFLQGLMWLVSLVIVLVNLTQPNGGLKSRSLSWRIATVRVAWKHVCERLSSFMVDMMGRAQQLVPVNTIMVVPSLGKGGPGYVRKATEQAREQARKQSSSAFSASVLAWAPALLLRRQWWPMTWKYKPKKPPFPQVAFGHSICPSNRVN